MEETQNTPVEVSDIIELDAEDFNFEEGELEVSETTEDNVDVANQTEETVVKEIDYTPFLQTISEKAKYNHEDVKVETLDEVINNFQKGLNYDKLKENHDNLNNGPIMTYIRNKAKENGVTPEEFINLVQQQEKQAEEEDYLNKFNRYIEEGIDETIAKELIETLKENTQFKKTKAEEKLQLQEKEQQDLKNKRYEDFIKSNPNVKVDTLPKEVVMSEDIEKAYILHTNKELLKELEILKQNQDNAKRNPVKGVSEHGGVEQDSTDPFLKGFNSDL